MLINTTLHLRIKKNYAADVINDLQKMDAIEFIKEDLNNKKTSVTKSPAIPNEKPLSTKALKALLLESEAQPSTSLETIKKQWEKKRKLLLK